MTYPGYMIVGRIVYVRQIDSAAYKQLTELGLVVKFI